MLDCCCCSQLVLDYVLDGFCWQQALCSQRWLVVIHANEDHGGQALDLQHKTST
jgi:hypothetical protein